MLEMDYDNLYREVKNNDGTKRYICTECDSGPCFLEIRKKIVNYKPEYCHSDDDPCDWISDTDYQGINKRK